MKVCPKCNKVNDDSSSFCIRCGCKLEENVYVPTNNVSSNVLKNDLGKKDIALVVLGYLAVFADLIITLGGGSEVRVINADRVMLYPALGAMLVYFVAVNIINNKKYVIHALIIAVIATLILFLGL